jgi:hypothetical protein
VPEFPTIDIRFLEEEMESWVIDDYASIVKNALPGIVDSESVRISERFDPNDEAVQGVISSFERLLDLGITTRFLTASVLLAAWSYYEAIVLKLSRYVAEKRNVSLGLRDLRGGFLEQARKYFEVLQWPLHEEKDWVFLTEVLTMRNAFAHANGRVSDLSNQSDRQRIITIVGRSDGATIEDNALVLSDAFVEETWVRTRDLTRGMLERVKADWPV